jgi:D-alanyl-D-alanine carboxypeptidase
MRDNVIPGAVLLITSPTQGDWIGTFGTGTIGRDVPMSAGDYFRVGSNTKTMTSTVILQLVQEGKLRPDDPIAKYRPGVPNGDKITIAQLSEMRSGLFSYTSDRGLNRGLNEALDRDPGAAWTRSSCWPSRSRTP